MTKPSNTLSRTCVALAFVVIALLGLSATHWLGAADDLPGRLRQAVAISSPLWASIRKIATEDDSSPAQESDTSADSSSPLFWSGALESSNISNLSSTRVGAARVSANLTGGPLGKHLPKHGVLRTSVKCKNPDYNRSCVFQNLYFYEGKFQVFLTAGASLPPCSVGLASKHGPRTDFAIRRFDNDKKIAEFLQEKRFKTWPGLTLAFDIMWHHNIGHALFDGLYPAFLALVKFGLQDVPFTPFVGVDPFNWGKGTMIEKVLNVFGGKPKMAIFEAQRKKLNIRFEVGAAGSRNMGQRHMNADVALHGGRDLGATRLFRNRMLRGYELAVSAPADNQWNVCILDNKRFSSSEKTMLKSIKRIGTMPVVYISWASIPKFAAQLKLIQRCAVHATSGGTAQMYQPFLSDGSVHVNFGHIERDRQWPFPFFMEQPITEGTPYIRALYYDPSDRYCGLKKHKIVALLEKAVSMHQPAGFPAPAKPGENLSPEGKIFRQLCAVSPQACTETLMSMNPDWSNKKSYDFCYVDAWVEHVIYEQGGWNPKGWRDNGKIVHCPADFTQLRILREAADPPVAPLHGKC